tara:strand:+ start:695 stop:5572 length:4878 start_codon:yes stop_codon:yes gene_type:complete
MPRVVRTDIENNGKLDFISKPILRTNPKLSSNVKVVVENDNMYLESFNATTELADARYKKYIIKPSGDYSYDVSSFWNINNTPLDLAYHVKKENSDFSVLDSFDKQFEKTYCYGTTVNYSKLHDYSLRILAPIWLDKNVPKKFLIYRVDKPIDTDIENVSNKSDKINILLAGSSLIKSFDLTRESDIGKYIRNHVESGEFPNSPITYSFNKGDQSFYNGIDLVKGGFVSRGEFHTKDTTLTDKPLIEYNQFITDGFYRNSIACANLMNLEFLFDDELAEEFSINRYFGVYVDDFEIGEGEVESIKKIVSGGDLVTFKTDTLEHNLDVSSEWMALPYSDWFSNMPMLGWVKSENRLHNIKNGANWNSQNLETAIESNGVDYSKFLGIKNTEKTINVIENPEGGGDFLKLKVIDIPNSGNILNLSSLKRQRWVFSVTSLNSFGNIKIKDKNNITVSSVISPGNEKQTLIAMKNKIDIAIGDWTKYNTIVQKNAKGKWVLELSEKEFNMEEDHQFQQTAAAGLAGVIPAGGVIKIKQTFGATEVTKNTFFADNTIPAGKISGNNFSCNGSVKNIAFSIYTLLKENTRFKAIVEGDTILIESPSKGYQKFNCGLFLSNTNNTFLELENLDTFNKLEISSNYLQFYNVYHFSGGNYANKSFYLKEEDANILSKGEYVLGEDTLFNRVLEIVDDSREVTSVYKKVILNLKNNNIPGLTNIYSTFNLKWGMFSAYNIHDLNFDFYDTVNSQWRELEYEERVDYTLDTQQGQGSFSTPAINPYNNVSVLNQEADSYNARLLDLLFDEDSKVTVNAERINSEFERLKENDSKDFSTLSRTVPFINKWKLKDSLNVRENPYYLNVNEAFGETNFSPMFTGNRDPLEMTHDWFYIDKYPSYSDSTNINDFYSYLKVSEDINIDFDYFKDVTFNYFDYYFVSSGNFVYSDNLFGYTSNNKKYTLMSGGSEVSNPSTIFKGIKFTPKLRKRKAQNLSEKFTKEFINSSDFNGYKFSTMLNVTYDSNSANGLFIKVCKNEKWKTVVLYLDLKLNEDPNTGVSYLNRKLLYELDNIIKTGQNTSNPLLTDTFYSDNVISGAINLANSQNITLTSSSTHVLDGFQNILTGEDPEFLSQVLRNPVDGTFGRLFITIGNDNLMLEVASVEANNKIKIKGLLMDEFGNSATPGFYTDNQWLTATYTYEGGGIKAHAELLEKLTVNNIKEELEAGKNIDYFTVKEDGSIIENDFSLAMSPGVEVIKKSELYVEVDTNKPKSFGLSSDVIGYDIQKRNEYFAILERHNGEYTIDTRPVITFREPFSMHKIDTDWSLEIQGNYNFNIQDPNEVEMSQSLYKKFNGCGLLFDIGLIVDPDYNSSWGEIKNYYFHKVNEISTEGVIKLSESSDLLPKYNLTGEIAIDKKDLDVFKSRWEEDFYLRASGKGKSTKVPGTKNIKQDKSFISSSAMKLGEAYDVYNFTINRLKNIEQLDKVKLDNNSKNEILFAEEKDSIIIDFYLTNSAVRELGNLGVRNTLKQYVSLENSFGRVDTLDDDVSGYVESNILPLYTVGNINLYVKEFKQTTPSHLSEIESSATISSVDDGGYEIKNEFTYKLDPKNPLNLRLIYNKKKGFIYKIKPLIKIKS